MSEAKEETKGELEAAQERLIATEDLAAWLFECLMRFIADKKELRDKLTAEEQRAADIETRTAVKLGEFAKITDIIDAECKRLGIDWHGSASTTLKAVIEAAGVQPGWICFEPTGETHIDARPIYRRIDAPAAAEPLPPPVSEQPDAGELVPQAVIDTLLSVLERTEAVDDDEYGCLAKTAALLRNGIIELRYTSALTEKD